MSLGNTIGSYARSGVSEICNGAAWTYQAADEAFGGVFTNPTKLASDLFTGFKYSLENKAYELASSSALILGATAAGVYAAKKGYSVGGRLGAELSARPRVAATKIALFSLSLACFALAGYEIYSNITENRTIGNCSSFKDLLIEHRGSHGSPGDSEGMRGYLNLDCTRYFGPMGNHRS